MSKYILVLCDYALRLPQRISWQVGFDLHTLNSTLRENRYFPIITHYEDPNIFDTIKNLRINTCIPATSWRSGYRELVNNKLVALQQDMGIKLLPRLALMLAYENKALQVELSKTLDLPMPQSYEVATIEGFRQIETLLGYPYVVKPSEGFGSLGVQLITDQTEAAQFCIETFNDTMPIASQGIGLVVMQQYIPDLSNDWKVLVIGDAAAVLFRETRGKEDFRASGSGKFAFKEAPSALLDFAYTVKQKLDAPWVSLDIVYQNNAYYLIEFQATHFGTYTTDKAQFHYVRNSEQLWVRQEGPLPVEYHMSRAILSII